MEEFNARAALVSAPDVDGGLTTSIPREEAEQALAVEDSPLELILDVTRFSEGEPETRSFAVAWERNDLEELLRQSEGDRIVLTFDRETLAQAMAADVEAHGLREKALVLAVAATAAAGAAGGAAAEPGPFLGTGDSAVQTTLGPDDRAVSRATPAPEASMGVDDRAVSRATPAPEASMGVDDRAVSRATPVAEPSMGVDDRAVSRATPVAEPNMGVDDRAVSRATVTPEPTIGVDDRAVPRGTSDFVTSEPSVAPGRDIAPGGGESWAPSPAQTAAIGGAIALAITGAAFVVAGRRRRPDVRPA
jgi:hypothetical protein